MYYTYKKLKDEPDIAKVQAGVKKIYEKVRTKVIEQAFEKKIVRVKTMNPEIIITESFSE